ncbi:hypothetical protein GGTG_01712 [Gaeumannomyces tritici R3-111a-1]|uniref:Tat pathway signal sequence n=1 Tax=Gaeumannomyces tritici (strain R3-111a-1) TaxID=644352 RepID=J3NKD3_GAET3|nr:hypothetical protein GGTG_01712 [Gaeumannomyces tritici R3-111a-1]EJT81737.1 hypothetical protein GGTG_01712 [Gaeumannomyces tritici R3-111a-1]
MHGYPPKMSNLYQSVPHDEEGSLTGDKEGVRTRRVRGVLSEVIERGRTHWTWIAHAVLLSASLTMLTLSLCSRGAKVDDLTFTKKYSSWSPAAPAVRYETVKFNLTPVVDSPYVGYGEEVDKAWDYIANDVGDQMISEEEALRMGSPLNSLKVKDPKTGKEGYRVGVEVFHQLHCLNLLRQGLYKNYYKDLHGDVGDASGKALHGHLDHCIEALRLNLMCQSDIGIFTFRLFPEYGLADDDWWPDFSTKHTCRNFEDIRKWGRDNTVSWDHNA